MDYCHKVKEDIEKYLNEEVDERYNSIESIEKIISDIPDIDKGVARFFEALKNKEKVFFVHDNDADGVGSAVISKVSCDFLGYPDELRYHRLTKRCEGYGFIPSHVDEAKKFGASLIITTDNGITSFDACKYAKENNIDVIITDHHQVSEYGIPEAFAVIDPQIIKNTHILKDISGAAVIYLFFIYLINKYPYFNFKKDYFFEELALTAVSDVMPMKHINRFFTKSGLEYFNKPRKTYTEVFLNNLIYENKVTAETLGFNLAPNINAAKRFDVSEVAYNFLLTHSYQEAEAYWKYLNEINEKRKSMTQEYFNIVNSNIKKIDFKNFIYINFDNANHGILGSLAGKLAEAYKKPVIITANDEDNIVRGSGRSVYGIDFLNILKKIDFVSCGGHKEAFGISFEKDKIKDFILKLLEESNSIELKPKLFKAKNIFESYFSCINGSIKELIDKFEPYGPGFKKPLLRSRVVIKNITTFGKHKNHVKFTLQDEINNIATMVKFFEDARNWNIGDKALIDYSIEIDSWSGNLVGRIQQIIKI